MITVMGDQNYSIEFFISFPTIYHYVVCDDGKVPAKIVLLYGGKSSYPSIPQFPRYPYGFRFCKQFPPADVVGAPCRRRTIACNEF